MTRKWLGVAVLFIALLKFCELSISAQGVAPPPLDDERPQLQISAPGSIFRQGELIPLTLSFTSKIPDRYQVNMAAYDRSGRMGYEQFLVEPTKGTSDPLAVYFSSALLHMAGGLTNFKFLSDSPYIVRLDLNEWVRFDAPGHYRVVVASRRVSDVSGSKSLYHNSFYQGIIQNLKSNSIDIEIVAPDFAWQQAQLREILLDLDNSPKEPSPFLTDFKSVALRRLRYLGSEDAARELARHMKGTQNPVDWNCMFGLIGSPNRMIGLAEMKRLMGIPDFPVTEFFLDTMAIIPLDPDNSAENLRQQKEANLVQARSLLRNNLSLKKEQALAVSVDTVLQYPDPSISEADRGKLVSLFIGHFDLLTIEQQRRWLEEKWSTVRGAQWVPTLRTIAAKYVDYPVPNAPNVLPAYNYFKLSGDALTRWYELDPEGARPAVLAEIVRKRPRYSANTLGMLPDKVLPNEERAIADHFLAAEGDAVEGNLASLLNRYADAAVLPQVLPKITRKLDGLWACIPENNAVAYVQKVDPEAAKPLIERVTSGCQKFPPRPDRP